MKRRGSRPPFYKDRMSTYNLMLTPAQRFHVLASGGAAYLRNLIDMDRGMEGEDGPCTLEDAENMWRTETSSSWEP